MSSPATSIPLWLAPLLVAATGCITTKMHSSPPAPPPAIAAAADRAWEVTDTTGEPLGFVVRFEENAPRTDTARAFYSVRNRYQQELGLVDDLGRSWRFEPHAKEPAWLGSGSIAEGTGRIFGTTIRLTETPLATLTARSPLEN